MTAKILYLPPRTPMASLIHSSASSSEATSCHFGLSSSDFASARKLSNMVLAADGNQVSEHYNAVCDGTFTSVLGLDHQQLVDEAVAEKAKTSPPLH